MPYDQMYSSAIAPLCHLATVTIRPPLANSPTTQVHCADPNLIGCDVLIDAMSWRLSLPVHENIVCVVLSEHAHVGLT
jgi:hypothetical protein